MKKQSAEMLVSEQVGAGIWNWEVGVGVGFGGVGDGGCKAGCG